MYRQSSRKKAKAKMLDKGSFNLKWETLRTKTSFPLITKPPGTFRLVEQRALAKVMSYEQILNTSVPIDDFEHKFRMRWKAMRQLYSITRLPEYNNFSFEMILYENATYNISEEHFVMNIIKTYKFPNNMKMDAHLRWLYWTFDNERRNQVDWRDILLYYKILLYFRFIKDRPLDLICILFDIYTNGEQQQIAKKEDFVLPHAIPCIEKVFLAPCITETEIADMRIAYESLIAIVDNEYDNQIKHHQFQRLLRQSPHDKIVTFWSKLMWDKLPSELRLTVVDEAQQFHKNNAEVIIARHKLAQAMAMYQKNTVKVIFREWKLYILRSTGVRMYHTRKLRRKVQRFFFFWFKLARRKTIKRRRRILGEVMGTYNIKARCFARIKLFNSNFKRIEQIVGSLHKRGRQFRLAGTHLREFRRINSLKVFYHRWWNKCVAMNNYEVAVESNRMRLLHKVFHPWHIFAHKLADEERQEIIARENKLHLDRMLNEAEEATKLLLKLEREREERMQREEDERQRIEKERRLQEARQKMQREKQQDKDIVLKIQTDERSKRITKDLKQLKALFKSSFNERAVDMLGRARNRMTGYIENPDNKLAIDMKVEALKREFFANPTPESKAREKVLSSFRNIMFLYIDAKLKADDIKIADLIPRFDVKGKGYLTYTEFASLVRSLKTSLNEAQINAVIRAIDADRDGYITIDEIYEAMKEIDKMGVPGSPWRLYIDPAEDVICYHNFVTNEKILEYKMTDKALRTITIANMYGEAEHTTQMEILEMKEREWKQTLEDYMVRRLQYMYRLWKARKWRKKKAWKVEKKVLRFRNEQQKKCIHFIVKSFKGYKCRLIFQKQLKLTIEKVYDAQSKQIFYYNHMTKLSTWEKPHLIRRHGDVTSPCPWIPLEDSGEDPLPQAGGQQKTQYWHVVAKRAFPRKPDGFPICMHCNHLIAIHKCIDCNMNYCFRCHRDTHSNPFGFLQKAKARQEEYSDPSKL